jgi:hypothetical protein
VEAAGNGRGRVEDIRAKWAAACEGRADSEDAEPVREEAARGAGTTDNGKRWRVELGLTRDAITREDEDGVS